MFSKKSKEDILNLFSETNYSIKKYSKNNIIAIEGDTCTSIGLVLEGNVDIKRMLGSKVLHLSSFSLERPSRRLNISERCAYSDVFCTTMSSGTRMRRGVKFQIAFIPHTTILSATSCARSMGTVRMPILTS